MSSREQSETYRHGNRFCRKEIDITHMIFEQCAYFAETVLNLSFQCSAIFLRSQNVRKMFRNGHYESSYNRKHIRRYSDKQSHIAFSSFRLVSDCSQLLNLSLS